MWNKNIYDGGTWTKERTQKVIPIIVTNHGLRSYTKTPNSNPTPAPSTQSEKYQLKLPSQHQLSIPRNKKTK